MWPGAHGPLDACYIIGIDAKTKMQFFATTDKHNSGWAKCLSARETSSGMHREVRER